MSNNKRDPKIEEKALGFSPVNQETAKAENIKKTEPIEAETDLNSFKKRLSAFIWKELLM